MKSDEISRSKATEFPELGLTPSVSEKASASDEFHERDRPILLALGGGINPGDRDVSAGGPVDTPALHLKAEPTSIEPRGAP